MEDVSFFCFMQDELERFSLDLVYEPTAIFKDDKREIYTNLILFTVLDDPRKRSGPSDMHIFQSIANPVSILKNGQGSKSTGLTETKHQDLIYTWNQVS